MLSCQPTMVEASYALSNIVVTLVVIVGLGYRVGLRDGIGEVKGGLFDVMKIWSGIFAGGVAGGPDDVT